MLLEKKHIYCKNLEREKIHKHFRTCKYCDTDFVATGKFCRVCDGCNPKEWMKSKVLYTH